jgi:hypothetical protein
MDSDDEWLSELTSAHRSDTARGLAAPSSPDQGDDVSWVEECLQASRAAVVEHATRLELRARRPTELVGSQGSECSAAMPAAPLPPQSTAAASSSTARPSNAWDAFQNFDDVCKFLELQQVPRCALRPPPGQDDVLWDALHDCTASTACPTSESASREFWVLGHVADRLAMWRCLFGVITFKIGIAADPASRYRNPAFGYMREGIWRFMDVLLAGPAFQCRAWEISLIRALKAVPGCYNEKPGGEGVAPTRDHRCYVYAVVADAGGGLGLQASVSKRRRLQLSAS